MGNHINDGFIPNYASEQEWAVAAFWTDTPKWNAAIIHVINCN